MVFTSPGFALFVTVAFAIHLVLPPRARNPWLLACSLWFYFTGAIDLGVGVAGLLLLATAVVDWHTARRIAAAADKRARWRWLLVSLVFDLGVLATFKYLDWFTTCAAAVLGLAGLTFVPPLLALSLPLAISFYTFQSLGYVLDVYRGRAKACASLAEYLLFLTFFPQLVLGPIERIGRLLPQIQTPREPTVAGFLTGSWLVFLGVYKKLAVADPLWPIAKAILPQAENWPRGLDVIAAATVGTIALYADFSGYSDIARGVARWFGFELTRNFRTPFFARNVQDFWGRWHVSLSTWIRDYLYLPMVVSPFWKRLGSGGLAIVTMAIMGFWHGPASAFVAWGVWHGLMLLAYGRLRPLLHPRTQFRSAAGRSLFTVVSIACTFLLCLVGVVLFSARDLPHGIQVLRMVVVRPYGSPTLLSHCGAALLVAAPLLWLDWLEWKHDDPEALLRQRWLVRLLVRVVLAACVLDAMLAYEAKSFAYFRF